MYRLVLALSLAVSLTLTSHGALAAPKQPKTTKAQRIVQHMLDAMQHESHIQVTGTTRGSARPTTSYTLRYQAPGREEYWASTVHKNAVAKSPTSLHYILFPDAMYSYIASRWYKLRGSSVPTPPDTLGLNANGASCCIASGIRRGETVRDRGTTTWHGYRVYKLTYRGATAAGGTVGTLYVSADSYLPRGYTVTNVTDKTTGTFTIQYGGSFTISAPKT